MNLGSSGPLTLVTLGGILAKDIEASPKEPTAAMVNKAFEVRYE
jgi:hypothetical protein